MNPTDPNFVHPINGGAAFPVTHSWRSDNTNGFKGAGAPGMTLTDYFAVRVAAVLLEIDPDEDDSVIASQSYDFAEALVAEKNKRVYPRRHE